MEIDLAQPGVDLSSLAAKLRSQVCIIGGGIAGLILADRLMQSGRSVTLLEAGGRRSLPEAEDDPFGAELSGRPHAGTQKARVRALGGCSSTWGGQLLPLPADANWPVSSAELRSFETHWGVSSDAVAFFAAHKIEPPGLLQELSELTPRLSRFIPFSQRNLARTLGRQLLASARVQVVLHAAVTELVLAPTRDLLAGVTVRTPAGATVCVEADRYVVAAGTVETCRLLLASRSVDPAGVGNRHGQVGLHFHDHLTLAAAEFKGDARRRVLAELRPWIFPERRQPQTLYSLKLEPSASLRAHLGLNPAMAHLTVEEPVTSGVGALRSFLRERQQIGSIWPWARRIGLLPGIVVNAARLIWEARVKHRRYVSPGACVYLQLNVARGPSAASRVRLSEATDRWGMPRATVEWQVGAEDLASLRRLASYLRVQFAAAGLDGDVVWQDCLFGDDEESTQKLLDMIDDARHAMGGARMGADPRSSVVDPDLTVHGVENLSIASAAVFPDGSAQLPTLTLSALCLRLAQRFDQQLKG